MNSCLREEDLVRELLGGLRPSEKIDLDEFCDKYRYLSRTASAEFGRWKTSRTEYSRQVMKAVLDPQS
jgi:phage terminase large subunit GpA-like protein